MVMKMNKTSFINELSEKLGYSIEECTKINEVIENNFIISRKSKDKIISELGNVLNIDEIKAEEIYNTSVEIITKSIKNRIKHPFKSQE